MIPNKPEMMINKQLHKIVPVLILISSFSGMLSAQDFPERPNPPRLVNDFAGMLNTREINALENKLVAYNDSTSTQIAIVIVKDLKGYDKSDYAIQLAGKWGIGQKNLNNGVLVLVKPKTETSRGEVFIAPGYGLEGPIPDLLCSQIVDDEILPAFRAGDYYGGLDKATSTLMSLASGEFSAADYGKNKKENSGVFTPFIIFIIFLIMMIFMRSSGGKNQKHLSGKGLPLWVLLSMMNSGRGSHSGSWGGFSGGSGGGGFGGFGGGGFGGGGAGGSW
jgi:uncharacterized protein